MSVADALSVLAAAATAASTAIRGMAQPQPANPYDRAQPATSLEARGQAWREKREQRRQELTTMDISQLLDLRPSPPGGIGGDDIADALIARADEVEEYKRNFHAPGAAEARHAAAKAEHNRQVAEFAAKEQQQRIERETQERSAAQASAEKEALAERRRAAVVARDAFREVRAEESRGREEARQTAAREAVVAANPDLADLYARSAESNKWTLIGREGTTHELAPGTRVRFGKDSQWVEKVVGPEGTITAGSDVFGRDPAPGIVKEIWKRTGGRRRTHRKKRNGKTQRRR